jgi:hypothetical protein
VAQKCNLKVNGPKWHTHTSLGAAGAFNSTKVKVAFIPYFLYFYPLPSQVTAAKAYFKHRKQLWTLSLSVKNTIQNPGFWVLIKASG